MKLEILLQRLLQIFFSGFVIAASAHAHNKQQSPNKDMIKEWVFWPDYTLPGSAKNYPGNRPEIIKPYVPLFGKEYANILMKGQTPSIQFNRLLARNQLPEESFAIELWVMDHVNRPVGVMAAIMDIEQQAQPEIAMGYNDSYVFFGAPTEDSIDIHVGRLGKPWQHEVKAEFPAFKKRWHHIVGNYDGELFTVYHNGKLLEKAKVTKPLTLTKNSQFVISGYLNNEPYMDIGNLLQYAAVYRQPLSQKEVSQKFAKHSALIEEGVLFSNMFHFTSGPYLNAGTETTMNILWETDRAASAVVEWGEQIPYSEKKTLSGTTRLQTIQLSDLKPDTAYFYRVSVTSGNETMDSGPLTFRTMPGKGKPLIFSVIGDTEARPFINDQIAKQVWGQRPHFTMIVGDLTDGGLKNYRWEWTHEYFLGITQLASRVPFIAAPGNGEEDLVWYQHYHNLPNNEYFYSYKVGDAEFFMLDSNMGHIDKHRPGFRDKQKAWLEKALKASTAKWKFAGHHHPVYSSDENDYGDTYKQKSANGDTKVRDDFLQLYEKYGVDMVFFGHLHSYERTFPIRDGKVDRNGVIYVQTGGGGGNHEEAGPTRNWFSEKVYSGYHYTLVHLHGNTLKLIAVDSEGRQRDSYILQRK